MSEFVTRLGAQRRDHAENPLKSLRFTDRDADTFIYEFTCADSSLAESVGDVWMKFISG